MKTLTSAAVLVVSALLVAGCGDKKSASSAATPAKDLASTEQRASYGIGYNLGMNLAKQPGLKVDQAAFAAGVRDALAGTKPALEDRQIEEALAEVQRRAATELEALAQSNLKAANEFLATNKARAGVKTTVSGLQYEVLQKGFGSARPKPASKVRVHYHGTLLDGTVFDSSVQRGQPAEFTLNGVIPGWTEALQLMAVGDKFKVYLPPALAYGPRGAGRIPPNAALVFEIELIAIN